MKVEFAMLSMCCIAIFENWIQNADSILCMPRLHWNHFRAVWIHFL